MAKVKTREIPLLEKGQSVRDCQPLYLAATVGCKHIEQIAFLPLYAGRTKLRTTLVTTLVGLTEDTSEAAALLDLDLGANNTAGGCFPASWNRLVSTSSWKITKHTNITGPWIPVKIMKSNWKSCATGFIINYYS